MSTEALAKFARDLIEGSRRTAVRASAGHPPKDGDPPLLHAFDILERAEKAGLVEETKR